MVKHLLCILGTATFGKIFLEHDGISVLLNALRTTNDLDCVEPLRKEILDAMSALLDMDFNATASMIMKERAGIASIVKALPSFCYHNQRPLRHCNRPLQAEEKKLLTSFARMAQYVSPHDGTLFLHSLVCFKCSHTRYEDANIRLELLNRVLAEFSGSASVPDKYGRLPLHVALEEKAPLSIIKALLKANADAISIRDSRGRLPLHLAIERQWWRNRYCAHRSPPPKYCNVFHEIFHANPASGAAICQHDPEVNGFSPAVLAAVRNRHLSHVFLLLRNDPSVIQQRSSPDQTRKRKADKLTSKS